ncbi:hypothetical protein [Micromonospora sicca]|uniref:hypothetical protein n=1 Tax=Micromonospora sicca TaxID=2202420 RepID=UPI001374D53D|nr:hypothetical protein [Micromonospora sp. 4G51]
MWLFVATAVVVAVVNRKALLDRGAAVIAILTPGDEPDDTWLYRGADRRASEPAAA